MGMEKNAAGHRLRLNKDMVGYFDAARQQGGCCNRTDLMWGCAAQVPKGQAC